MSFDLNRAVWDNDWVHAQKFTPRCASLLTTTGFDSYAGKMAYVQCLRYHHPSVIRSLLPPDDSVLSVPNLFDTFEIVCRSDVLDG